RDLVDETLARSTHENRQTESFELGKPRDHGETLVRRLAEADTGIEHYIFAGNTRRGRDSKRAVEEVGDIPHDVDGRIGRVAVVNDNDRHAVLGNHAGKFPVALQSPDVVDDRGTRGDRPSRDLRL